METQINVDPRDNLSRFVDEVIASFGKLSTKPAVPSSLPPTSVPILDCTAVCRESVSPSPLYALDPNYVWTHGLLCKTQVLTLARMQDATIKGAIYRCEHKHWTEPFAVPIVDGGTICCGATAAHATLFSLCTPTSLQIFAITDCIITRLVEWPLDRPPITMAMSANGEMIAIGFQGRRQLQLFGWNATRVFGVQVTMEFEDDDKLTELALNPGGTMLSVVNRASTVFHFPITSDGSECQLEPAKTALRMMPSEAAVFTHYSTKEKGLLYQLDEQAVYVTTQDDNGDHIALATRHHLSIKSGDRQRFMADRAAAVAVMLHTEFYAILDAAGMLMFYDWTDLCRHVVAPEQRDYYTCGRKPILEQVCPCEMCEHRTHTVGPSLCRPAIVLSDDGATVWVVDQWAVVRTIVASRAV